MKYKKLLLFVLPLLYFSACNVSTLSKKDRQDLSKFQVKITIKNNKLNTGLNQTEVLLTDGIKQIINNDITILLNDKELEHYIEKGILFNKTSYYKTPSLERNDSYFFEIVLSDNSRHPLAFIEPFEKQLSAKFNLPNHIAKNEDFILKWIDLKTPHQIEFTTERPQFQQRGVRTKAFNRKSRGLSDTLYSSSGEYTIPKSYFNNESTKSKNLAIKLYRTEYGMINPLLIENSSITYIHTIEKLIHIEDRNELVLSQ